MTIVPKIKLPFFITIFAVFILFILVEHVGFLEGIDTYIYDTSLRIKTSRAVSDRVVIVAIDNNSLSKMGRWPLQRGNYARLLEKLNLAAVVGFDLIMTEPASDDQVLAAAITRHGKVVLPVYVADKLQVVKPLAAFTPFRTGHIHVEHGVDTVTRTTYHTLYTRDELLPSMSSVMYEALTGVVMQRQILRDNTVSQQHGRKLYQLDQLKINFYGPPGTFKQISLADIIAGNYPPEYFRGKAVLVGLTAPGIVDEIATPFSQNRDRMSGIEVHANALNNLLDGNSITNVADWKHWLVALLASFFLCLAFMMLAEKPAQLLLISSLVLVMAGTFCFLSLQNMWVRPSLFYLSFCFAYFIAYLYHLDCAARELDREYVAVTSLLACEGGNNSAMITGKGLFGLLSASGIHAKIKRLVWVEQHYERTLEETVQQRTLELSEALAMISSMSNEMILRLTKAVETKDEGTGEHIERVGLYAARIAEALEMPPDFIEAIRFASAMHDLGKIGIPDRILMKPAPLDHDEMEIMKTHPHIGARILANSAYPKIQMAARIAQNHHERWDGSGYPQGLQGEAIPIEARIIIICDIYDALRSRRPYKAPFDHQKSCEIITQSFPLYFDSRILDAFTTIHADFAEIFDQHQD